MNRGQLESYASRFGRTVEEAELCVRLFQARQAGWKFEDSLLTPGCPRMVAISPCGKVKPVFSLGWKMHSVENQLAELDEAGVPKLEIVENGSEVQADRQP